MTKPPRPFVRNIVFSFFIVVLMLGTIEVLVRVAAAMGWCQIRVFQVAARQGDIRFLGDTDPHFGVWHVPQTSVEVKTPRGKVTYETNRQGMRDRPRDERSTAPRRVVVLGDSFIEGSYVEETNRVTDVLEERTGIEFLNFGTSGSFGSIQEWLLYEHLASRFDHSHVLVFLLPDNDFTDNDPAHHSPDRYRPYLSEVGDSYEVTYPIPFGEASTSLSRLSWGRRLRHRLYNQWYSLNLIVHRDLSEIIEAFESRLVAASYDQFSPKDLDRLLFSYRQILELAAPRPVTIFIIPRDKDFMAHQGGRFQGKIVKALSEFAQEQDRLSVVDLLPSYLAYMKENDVSYKQFFLDFDPHWSPLGHRVAADAVLAALREREGPAWPAAVTEDAPPLQTTP